MKRLTTLFIILLSLSACAAPAPAATEPPLSPVATSSHIPDPTATDLPTATPPPTTTPLPTVPPPPDSIIGPGEAPPGVNPLTGLTVDDPSMLARRPLFIKISNAPEIVRPQSGLSKADVMFEYYVEGGWTRFAAIFYSQGFDHVGPVRSGRLVDLQLAPAFDALLVFSGASQGVTDTIRESDLYPWNTISPQFGWGEPWFVRFPREGLAIEHTMYTDTSLLWDWADERNVRAEPSFKGPGFAFYPVPPSGGTPAATASLDYARTSVFYRYDPISERYLRWTDGIPHTDSSTGQQLGFENVIVIGSTLELVDLFPEKYFGAEQSLYIEMTGTGPATLLRDGQAFTGRWVREGEEDRLSFVGADGQPLLLKPGHTFIHIVRTGFEELITEP